MYYFQAIEQPRVCFLHQSLPTLAFSTAWLDHEHDSRDAQTKNSNDFVVCCLFVPSLLDKFVIPPISAILFSNHPHAGLAPKYQRRSKLATASTWASGSPIIKRTSPCDPSHKGRLTHAHCQWSSHPRHHHSPAAHSSYQYRIPAPCAQPAYQMRRTSPP